MRDIDANHLFSLQLCFGHVEGEETCVHPLTLTPSISCLQDLYLATKIMGDLCV